MKPTQPQADFHALTCKHPAFVGGFGTGKSETMANQAFMDASVSSSALIGLYEPTYDLVRLIMAPRIEEKLQQYGIRYKYNKSENIIYSSNNQFGDFILRTLDNPARIIGYETYRSHVDEIDTLKEEKAQEAWI
ncbi:MAG TPA: terminase, partial [Methylococcaceae bacterium]|nr:terminase [Methylococcaceae bacterium]